MATHAARARGSAGVAWEQGTTQCLVTRRGASSVIAVVGVCTAMARVCCQANTFTWCDMLWLQEVWRRLAEELFLKSSGDDTGRGSCLLEAVEFLPPMTGLGEL